ncbi:uncharacterized protein LOC135486331 [Lineus longissimus]|uniref:uncharacterized protein LOC135486331 n=1 Tax=Lineus longissimus TaxID=88925 RepID=UPI00315D389F
MEVILKSNDRCFHLLDEVRGHLDNGRNADALRVARIIRGDGDSFKTNIHAAVARLEGALESKKSELEDSQNKCHKLDKEEEQLREKLGEDLVEHMLCDLFSTVFECGAQAAESARDEAQRAYAQAAEDRSGFHPLHLVPVFGWAALAAKKINGSARMNQARQHQEAAENMIKISKDLKSASEAAGQEAMQRFAVVHGERIECLEQFGRIHQQCGELKESISIILKGSKALENILALTDSACGGTDALKATLEEGQKTPALLASRGTQTTINVTEKRWGELCFNSEKKNAVFRYFTTFVIWCRQR